MVMGARGRLARDLGLGLGEASRAEQQRLMLSAASAAFLLVDFCLEPYKVLSRRRNGAANECMGKRLFEPAGVRFGAGHSPCVFVVGGATSQEEGVSDFKLVMVGTDRSRASTTSSDSAVSRY